MELDLKFSTEKNRGTMREILLAIASAREQVEPLPIW
jgi:hypothetical protein